MTPDMGEREIVTYYVYPPIPIRDFDWQATQADWDLGDPIGFGPTEETAVQDLLEMLIEGGGPSGC